MSEETEGQVETDEAAPQMEAAPADGDRASDLEAELARMKDALLRKQAEFDNYRKRVDRERQEFAAYATAELIREILPVVDNLERALNARGEGADERLREGVEIIHRQFQDVLKKAGLREVPADASHFDPHLHEAVDRVETTEHDEGAVVEVLQKGYFLKDRLLRPALVKVAKHPPEGVSRATEASETEAPAVED